MTAATTPRVVFFGTPDWSVPSLEALVAGPFEVVAVVTNPDRPAGRGYELKASPVKTRALELGLPILQPKKARAPEFSDQLRDLAPDVAAVVAYGKILPGDLLGVPPHGFVNMHFSLLPAYRGAAPVQRAVMDGVDRSGAAIMVLTEGMDEGPVLAVEEVEVGPDETAGELGARLADIGGSLLAESLSGYLAGTLVPVAQDDSRATYAPKITGDEARIDWTEPAIDIKNKVRGLNPSPGAWTTIEGKRLKVGSVALATEVQGLEPGELRLEANDLVVGTGDGAVCLRDVQLAGKKATTGAELGRGLRLSGGERLGDDAPNE